MPENSSKLPRGLRIRPAVAADVPDCQDLSQEAYGREWGWTALDFLAWRDDNGVVLIAEGQTNPSKAAQYRSWTCETVGYVAYQPEKTRIVVAGLAVGLRWRGHGIGRALVRELLAKLSPTGKREIIADVPLSLLGACKWLRHLGIVATGVRTRDNEDYVRFRVAAETGVSL